MSTNTRYFDYYYLFIISDKCMLCSPNKSLCTFSTSLLLAMIISSPNWQLASCKKFQIRKNSNVDNLARSINHPKPKVISCILCNLPI